MSISTAYRMCPNCRLDLKHIVITEPIPTIIETCPHCGHYTILERVRDVCDIVNDKGVFHFKSIGNRWGYCTIKADNGLEYSIAVDSDYCDSFLAELIRLKNELSSATLSYLKDGEIVEQELLNLLK